MYLANIILKILAFTSVNNPLLFVCQIWKNTYYIGKGVKKTSGFLTYGKFYKNSYVWFIDTLRIIINKLWNIFFTPAYTKDLTNIHIISCCYLSYHTSQVSFFSIKIEVFWLCWNDFLNWSFFSWNFFLLIYLLTKYKLASSQIPS